MYSNRYVMPRYGFYADPEELYISDDDEDAALDLYRTINFEENDIPSLN